MARSSHYPLELRRRAVRMVAEVRPECDTEWAAMKAVAQKLGIGTIETLRKWTRSRVTVREIWVFVSPRSECTGLDGHVVSADPLSGTA